MKKIFLIALLTVFTFSCEDFEGWNIDEKHPASVSGSFLFTHAERMLAIRMQSTSVNYNIFRLYAQQWNETLYTDETNYDLANRDIGGNFWQNVYYDVLANTTAAKLEMQSEVLLGENQLENQMAQIEILEVFTFHVLVDVYANIPYSEALKGLDNLVPSYDDDADIYMDLFDRLDAAIATLGNGGVGFGDADLFYGGDIDSWITLANSIKLRMALRIADYDATMAKTKAEEAYEGGVMMSNADNMVFPFESGPPNTHPVWTSIVQSGRNDFVLANTFVDFIVPLNDPRTPVFMDDNIVPYKGGTYGEGSSYATHTHIGDAWHQPDLEGKLMTSSEVAFLVAEAAARGFIAADAATYYNMGIELSMEEWEEYGLDASAVPAYMAQASVAYDAANWKKSIGGQKYISLYGRGFEAWASWKLLDEPAIMSRPPVSELPVPRRYIYPNDEEDVNGPNYEAASSAIGGDALESRVFWDITGVGN